MALLDAIATDADTQAIAENRALVIPDDREAIDDSGSLSDHEATYAKGAPKPVADDDPEPAKPRAEDGRFQPRHRAKSQQASPDDVATIKDLTRQLREKEEALGKIKPATGTDSPRVVALKRQIRALEVDLTEAQPKPITPPPPAVSQVPTAIGDRPAPLSTPSAFTQKEPTLEEFAGEADPYSAWQRALGRYDRAKERFDEQQTTQRETQARQQREAQDAGQRHVQGVRDAYGQSLHAYVTQYPDRQSAFQGIPDTPPLMNAAIMTLANGVDVLYRLRQQPHLFHEAALFAYDKPVDDVTVAHMQRWLESRVPAGITGAAATPVQTKPLPSPPTPVRTGSNLSSGTPPPGDGASLSEHESFFHKRRR